jgi:hypothetical protein
LRTTSMKRLRAMRRPRWTPRPPRAGSCGRCARRSASHPAPGRPTGRRSSGSGRSGP